MDIDQIKKEMTELDQDFYLCRNMTTQVLISNKYVKLRKLLLQELNKKEEI